MLPKIVLFFQPEAAPGGDLHTSGPTAIHVNRMRDSGRGLFSALAVGVILCAGIALALAHLEKYSGLLTWVYLCLGIGVLSLVGIVRDPPGLFWAFALISPLLAAAGWGVLVGFLENPHSIEDLFGLFFYYMPASGLLYLLFSINYLAYDGVPLDHPLAWLVYLGRYGHMRSMRQFAEKYSWEFIDASPTHHAVEMFGNWRGREAAMINIWFPGRRAPGVANLNLGARALSKYKLWPLLVLSEKPRSGIPGFFDWVREQIHGSQEKSISVQFGSLDQQNLPDPAEVRRHLEPVLAAGSRFLTRGAWVEAVDDQINFVRPAHFRIKEQQADLEQLVEWLARVATNMEMLGYTSGLYEPEEALEAPPTPPAADPPPGDSSGA